jgi:membrane protease YdiL (CAAX protease family)
MGVRAVVYRLIPAYSGSDWFIRDAWMTVPRFASFIALLCMNRLLWKSFQFDIDVRRYRRAVLYGLPLVGLVLWGLAESCGRYWPRHVVLAAAFTTPFVGAFEECAWRGVVLEALRARRSTFTAIVLSSLLFTLYHVQAQPFSAWPAIFLIGVVLANYRIRGLSIFWLAIIHTVVDTAVFLFATDYFPIHTRLAPHVLVIEEPAACPSHEALILSGLLLLGLVTYPRASRRPGPDAAHSA